MENNEIINVQMTKEVFETLGSGGNGGSSELKYYNIQSLDISKIEYINIVSLLKKFINKDNFVIIATSTISESTMLAITIDFNLKVSAGNQTLLTVKQMLQNFNIYDELIACPELTEEQFYDLTLPTE